MFSNNDAHNWIISKADKNYGIMIISTGVLEKELSLLSPMLLFLTAWIMTCRSSIMFKTQKRMSFTVVPLKLNFCLPQNSCGNPCELLKMYSKGAELQKV